MTLYIVFRLWAAQELGKRPNNGQCTKTGRPKHGHSQKMGKNRMPA